MVKVPPAGVRRSFYRVQMKQMNIATHAPIVHRFPPSLKQKPTYCLVQRILYMHLLKHRWMGYPSRGWKPVLRWISLVANRHTNKSGSFGRNLLVLANNRPQLKPPIVDCALQSRSLKPNLQLSVIVSEFVTQKYRFLPNSSIKKTESSYPCPFEYAGAGDCEWLQRYIIIRSNKTAYEWNSTCSRLLRDTVEDFELHIAREHSPESPRWNLKTNLRRSALP